MDQNEWKHKELAQRKKVLTVEENCSLIIDINIREYNIVTLKHSWTSLWIRWSLFLSFFSFLSPSLWNIVSAYVTQFVSLISILNNYDRDINFPDLDFPKWYLVIVECWNTVHSLIKPLRRQNMANLKTLEKGKDKNKLNSLIQRFKYPFSILLGYTSEEDFSECETFISTDSYRFLMVFW